MRHNKVLPSTKSQKKEDSKSKKKKEDFYPPIFMPSPQDQFHYEDKDHGVFLLWFGNMFYYCKYCRALMPRCTLCGHFSFSDVNKLTESLGELSLVQTTVDENTIQ